MLSYGKISADDKNNTEPSLIARNLNFTSAITELSVVGQLYLFNSYKSRINPYVMAGIAVFRHNPYTFDAQGEKFFLKPLGTEGQGLSRYPDKSPYSLTQFAFPFGGGIKFAVTEAISIGWEIGARKTFTDYLDDVSGTYADQAALLAGRGPKAVELAFRTPEITLFAAAPAMMTGSTSPALPSPTGLSRTTNSRTTVSLLLQQPVLRVCSEIPPKKKEAHRHEPPLVSTLNP